MPEQDARVVAVTATHRRPAELTRLLASLEKSALPLRGIIVVDNAGDPATAAVTATSPGTVYLPAGENLGCGGGLAFGEKAALERYPDLTHLWILDDDAVVEPDTLGVLIDAMKTEDADAAHPLVLTADGGIGWFPGLLDREKYRIIREPQIAPEQFTARCGDAPISFSWAQGIALLITRRVLDELGVHRTDYWVRGEDLEFSLRITHHHRGIYVPRARVAHLPPEPVSNTSHKAEYTKHLAMLRNIAYTSFRLPHGRRIARTIPGNCFRFLRTWGWRPHVITDVAKALGLGVFRGPAGV